jgi:hypothetical protein
VEGYPLLRRLCVIAALACIFPDSVSAASSAAAAAASLTVHITDNAGRPIWLARATVGGPVKAIAASVRAGDAVFAALPPGTYHLTVTRYGYASPKLDDVVLAPGERRTLAVQLISTAPRQIAAVTARTPAKDARDVQAGSTQAQLGDSVVTALQSLPGITFGTNGAASIQGYSPNQTTITINGVPVSLPGSSQTLALFNADIFSGASVTPGSSGGGTVGFTTRSPSLAWQGVVRFVGASDHGRDIAVQEAGTIGRIGVSYSHARNVVSNALDGLSFRDTSGLFYSHDASPSVNGDALQLRYEFSTSNTLLANAVALDSSIPLVCNQWTGALPCGYGPTNLQRQSLTSLQLDDSARLGTSTVDLKVYANHIDDAVDQSGYFVDGVNLPSTSFTNSRQSGAIVNASVGLGPSFDLPLTIQSDSVSSTGGGNAFGPLLPSVLSRYTSLAASTSLPLVRRPHFSLGSAITYQRYGTASSSIAQTNDSLDATYGFSNHDSIDATYSPGNLGTPIATFDGVSSPAQLQFVCNANIGVGTGPSSASSAGKLTSTSAQWSHSNLGFQASLSASRSVQTGGLVSATVSALGLDPSLFPLGYVALAQATARTACGDARTVSLGDLYFDVSGAADRVVRTNVSLSLSEQLSAQTRISAIVSRTSAVAYGADPLIFGPRSTVIAGRQLPQVAPYSANLSFSTSVGHNAVALFNAHATSSNNSNDLPGYTTFDAGILAQLPRGLLSITMTNIGNAYPGPFAVTEGAVPLATLDGAFPTVAQPIAPRTLRVGYRFHIGGPERNPSFDVPNEQFQRPGGGFTFYWNAVSFENGPPKDPFAIDREDVGCGPKDVAPAGAILAAWQRYAASVEAARANGQYPATFAPATFGAILFSYLPNGESYAIVLSPSPGHSMVDFAQAYLPVGFCALVHQGSDKDIADRHLLVPPPNVTTTFVDILPRYAPEVGLYRAATFRWVSKTVPAARPNATSSPTPRPTPTPHPTPTPVIEPTPPPNQPFALKNWSLCTDDIRPAAQEFLDGVNAYVHAYFDLHQRPPNPAGMQMIAHRESSGKVWLEIRTADLQSMAVVIRPCVYVRDYQHAYLQRKGLDGTRDQTIDYAPGFGLYSAY